MASTNVIDDDRLSSGIGPGHDVGTTDTRFSKRRGLHSMGSLIKKRRKKMSKHKYRKRLKANRHKRKK